MKKFEYRIDTVSFTSANEREQHLLELANRLGQQGWQVSSLEVAPRIAVNEGRFSVLFMRELRA